MAEPDLSTFKSLILQKQFSKCQLLLSKSLKTHPLHPELLYLRAFLHRKNSKFEDALLDLEASYKNLPQQHPLESEIRSQIGLTYNEMGQVLFSKGRYDESIEIFNEALKFRENDWGILMNRGDCHVKVKNYREGLRDFVMGFEKAGDLREITIRIANVYYLLGLEEFNRKDYKGALKEFEKMIAFRGDFAGYYVIRGKCFYELNDCKNAYEDFKKAVEIDKGNQEARNYMGLIKKPENKPKKQVIYLE